MATAVIRIDGVIGSDTDLELGNLITFSNNDDTGVSTWLWVIEDAPAGSVATLATPAAATTTFTPDLEGTYLVSLDVNTGADTDQIVAAIRTLRGRLRIPAAGERTEEDASRGWAVSRNRDLRNVNRLLQAGGVQVGLIPAAEAPADATSWKRGNVVASSTTIDVDPSAGGTHVVPIWRKPSTIIAAVEKIQLVGIVLEDTDGLTSFDQAVANVPGISGHVVNVCIHGYVDGITGALDFTDAGNFPHGTTVGDPLFLETDNGNAYEVINFNDDFGTTGFAGGATANHLEYDTENYFLGVIANTSNPGAVFVTNDFMGEHRTSPLRLDNGVIAHSIRLGGATNTVGNYGGTVPLNTSAGAIEVECFDISHGAPTTFTQFDIVSIRPSDSGDGNHRADMLSAHLADESDTTTYAYIGMISDVGQAPSTGRNMKATILGCVTGCAAAFPGGAVDGEVLYIDPANPGKMEQLSALTATDTRVPLGRIISTTVSTGIFVVWPDNATIPEDEWTQGSGLLGGRNGSAVDMLYPTTATVEGVGWLEQAAGTAVVGKDFIYSAQKGSDALVAVAGTQGGGAKLHSGYGGDADASDASGTAGNGGILVLFTGNGGAGATGANPHPGGIGGTGLISAGVGGAGDETLSGVGGALTIFGGQAGQTTGGAGAYNVSGVAGGLLGLSAGDGSDGLNGGTGVGVADGGVGGALNIITGDGGDGDIGASGSSGDGGAGGLLSITGGAGGVGDDVGAGVGDGGAGAGITITGGAGGVATTSGTGGAGGDVQLIGGAGSGAGATGIVKVGAGTPLHLTGDVDDFLVTNELEVLAASFLNGGVTIDGAAGPAISITPDLTTETSPQISIEWDFATYTGTPDGISINYNTIGTLDSAGNIVGIALLGEPNIGAGNSYGLSIDQFWDFGFTVDAPSVIGPNGSIIFDDIGAGGTSGLQFGTPAICTLSMVSPTAGDDYLGLRFTSSNMFVVGSSAVIDPTWSVTYPTIRAHAGAGVSNYTDIYHDTAVGWLQALTGLNISGGATSLWGIASNNAGTQTLTIDAINAGAGEGQLILSADDQININDGTLNLQFNAGVVTETGMVSIDLTPSGNLNLRGGGVSAFGDDVAYWNFDGLGAVTETGMTSFSVTPSGIMTLTAGATSTWSLSGSDAGTQTLTIDAANAGAGEGHLVLSADNQVTLGTDDASMSIGDGPSPILSTTNTAILQLNCEENSYFTIAADAVTDQTLTLDSINIGAGDGNLTVKCDDNLTLGKSGINIGMYDATPTAQASAPTAVDATVIDATYGADEEGVLNNVRTRIGEVIAALQAIGIMA